MSDITLIGGGRDPEAQRACVSPFLAAATARSAAPRIGLVWVDEGDGTDWSLPAAEVLRHLGEIRPVDLRVPLGAALDPSGLAGLDAVFVCSGLTPAYADALAPVASELRRLVQLGVPYAGSSAGAAVAATSAVVGGYHDAGRVVCPPDAAEDLDEVTVVAGLGLVPEMVDVHASAWGTLPRLESAMALTGVTTGLGVDEDTAWHVSDRGSHVLGRHAVHRLVRSSDGVLWSVHRAAD